MTMYGYEIRNEYGLGAAELYKTVYQDDPEAILEGVAVAGLVGFLRQLGDLAEFAAEIFHGLHEEIANTASRSQNIMRRVQQLEADLPMVEKDLFHNNHTDFASIEGISWHLNLETDSNIVTKEEMPRYVMEFYKQSRGPPQLFRLDKFDMAGAGACLKRHTNPSFFKVDLSTYGITQGYQRENRKVKATRKLNPTSADIARSLKMAQTISSSEISTRDENSDEIPIRRVKLKKKQFNGSFLLGHMQNLLETDSPAHESSFRSISHTSTKLESPNEYFVTVKESNANTSHKRLKSLYSFINDDQNRQDRSGSDEKDDSPSSELLSNSSTTQNYQTGSLPDPETESGGNSDGYISDATASEVEFMDALTTTVYSDVETDSEVNEKKNPSFVRVESRKFSKKGNGDQTEQVPLKPIAGTEDASPISDGDVEKSVHQTEPHNKTVSFKKVPSKKVSYEENELNSEAPRKLQKDSFSHSLRHMAMQLLELKEDLTEEEELDLQDLEENEDEFLFDRADVGESGIIEKGEVLIENVQSGSVEEVNKDLIEREMETIEATINSTVASLGEDQVNLTSHENELKNKKSTEIERLGSRDELDDSEINASTDVWLDGEKKDEISMDGTVTNNICKDGPENINYIEVEKLDSQEDLHEDETENGEETDETVTDSTVAESLMRGLKESMMAKPQNLTLVEKEQELVESEVHVGYQGMQHGEQTNGILGNGAITKRATMEMLDNDMTEDQNLNSVEVEEFCESEMHSNGMQNCEKIMEDLINEEGFDSDMSEPENLKSIEKELYETEMHVGLDGIKYGAETYEEPVDGTETGNLIETEGFDSENLKSIEKDVYGSEMHVGSDSINHGAETYETPADGTKTENLVETEDFDSENLKSIEKELYESEMRVGLDGIKSGAETYEKPVDGTETENLIETEDFDSDSAEFQILDSPKNGEEFLENEMDVWSDDMQVGEEAYEIPTMDTVDESSLTGETIQENLLPEQNVYHGDATQLQASECPFDEERTLSDNLTEQCDPHPEIGLCVETLVDRYELLEEEARATEVTLVSPRPLIKDNIILEALLDNHEPSAEGGGGEEEEVEAKIVPVVPHPVEEVEAADEAESVIPATIDPVTDFDTEIKDAGVTPVAHNSSFPPIPSIALTKSTAPEEGCVVPALPPLPPIQWRTGKPQMGPLPSLGPMAPPPRFSKFGALPSFSKLGRPPRPNPSRAARDRQLHEAEIEHIGENCEMIPDTEEFHNSVMSPSLEKDTSTKEIASVERNPISDDTVPRFEEVKVRELSVTEEPLSTGDDKFVRQMEEEEPFNKLPPVPIPPNYPLFQVTSHDKSMLKKAPTLIQPANRLISPSMLEEIKNKSFSLKPVMVRKPNFMGPYSRTNLKVAAMLEKANAIRQAVGSDESDNDSWSE